MPAKEKINYEANLPPFLQRLHAQKAGLGQDADRHERQIARPRRAQVADEDDGPTVVDESGEVVGKDEFERLNGNGQDGQDSKPEENKSMSIRDDDDIEEERKIGEQKITEGTVRAGKKRKAVKVVGEDEGEDLEKATNEAQSEKTTQSVKKVKKKAKPIKLAFDDANEDT